MEREQKKKRKPKPNACEGELGIKIGNANANASRHVHQWRYIHITRNMGWEAKVKREEMGWAGVAPDYRMTCISAQRGNEVRPAKPKH